jgi:CRISPR-associated protein Cmr1
MRRKIPEVVENFTAQLDWKARPKTRPLVDITLHLECITPVFGGGVRSREPDMVDVVRVPGIRGQLRFWWRAVGNESTVEELFKNETAVWGGVSGFAGTATVSRVRVAVENVTSSVPFAAGKHDESTDEHGNKSLRSLPSWNPIMGKELGYGLFPLQRSRSELAQYYEESRGPMGTHKVRERVRFCLRLIR